MPALLPMPKDRTKKEHVGRVIHIAYSDPVAPFAILALEDNHTVLVNADADRFGIGNIYRFCGRWDDDAKRGFRFRAETYVLNSANGRSGIVKYLSTTCEGIGERLAERLWQTYGPETVDRLRTEPDAVAARCGVSVEVCQDAARDLENDKKYSQTRIDLFGIFAGRGFSGKLIDACIKKWGAKAPTQVRRNPFGMLGMPSAGFKRCDKLWFDFGLPANSIKRQAIVAANLAKTDTTGHTWIAAETLVDSLAGLIGNADPVKAFKLALRARMLAKYRDADGRLWLASASRANSERRAADAIRRLLKSRSVWPTDRVPVSAEDNDRLPSEHQVERLKLATSGAVGLLLGGPGTGKTHSVAYLLKEVLKEFGRYQVAFCAPTGKAAMRGKQALKLAGVDVTASTIHGMLGIGRNGHDGDGWEFNFNATCPLPYRFILVDESSMIDADLMASLLAACADGTQVLFIGDPYQLPPVGHGAPLRDLVAAGVPHGELTQVRRNAGMIVHACVRIKNGEEFETAAKLDLDAEVPANLLHVSTRDEAQTADVLEEILKAAVRFNPVWQTQVIVARNKGSFVARKELNDRLQKLLNPDGPAAKGNPFRVHDKIVCTKNSRMHAVAPLGVFGRPDMEYDTGNYDTMTEKDEFNGQPTPVEIAVANGELGRVVAAGTGITIARFSEGEHLVKIPMGKERAEDAPEADGQADSGRGCNFDLAYAMTCHKMQGSESPCVVVIGDPQAGMVANKQWVYTALSRASKVCILLGQRSIFNKMIARESTMRRKTFMVELLAGLAGKDGAA